MEKTMHIFYFSGTGNSFYVAKRIAMQNKDTELISIPGLLNSQNALIKYEKVIIVCPLYFYGVPKIVNEFIERYNFNNTKYFAIVFSAEYPNGIAKHQMKELCDKNKI
jgi:flavodoxin